MHVTTSFLKTGTLPWACLAWRVSLFSFFFLFFFGSICRLVSQVPPIPDTIRDCEHGIIVTGEPIRLSGIIRYREERIFISTSVDSLTCSISINNINFSTILLFRSCFDCYSFSSKIYSIYSNERYLNIFDRVFNFPYVKVHRILCFEI